MIGFDGSIRWARPRWESIPHLAILAVSTAVFLGCAMEESDLRREDPSELRARIVSMYNGYRVKSFPNAPDIAVEDLPLEGKYVLVDCRNPDERSVSTIESAIPLSEFTADSDRYRDDLIIPYCTIGYRSGLRTKKLVAQGFNAKNMIGGVLLWAHADRPFVDTEGVPTQRVHVYGEDWDLLPDTHDSVYAGKP